jgi:hypothetical protein
MDCAPENTREPRTGASARAFRVAVLDESYASAESFTLRGKVFAGSCGKKLYGTVPCTRPPGRFSFLDETPHPCHSDAQACSHSCTKLPTLVIPTPSPVLIPGRNSPPSSFRRPGLFSFLGETLHPCHSDAKPVLIPGRNSPPLSFRRRKAEESAALHIVAESILRCSQLKRQASPPARRARHPPPDLHASPFTT